MRTLIAEDDPVSRRALEATLARWGYDVEVTSDGNEAWARLQELDTPHLLVLDWMMPGMSGPDVCRRARSLTTGDLFYIILLTAKGRVEDVVGGLDAGADDYVCKPYHNDELRARVRSGQRIIELRMALEERIQDLERALTEVRQLRGLLPICAYCKKIKEGEDYWRSVESYFQQHSDARFSHGICPECYENIVKPGLEEL